MIKKQTRNKSKPKCRNN